MTMGSPGATLPADRPVVSPVSEALASDFRLAMRRLAATVSIIATRENGLPVGMAATSVSSLSASPPALLFSVAETASLCAPLMRQRRFSVSVLSVSHANLVGLFSGQIKGPERFAHGDWQDIGGMPFLADAQAWMLCRVVDSHIWGSQHIIIGQIEDIRIEDKINPLIWQNGAVMRSAPLDA